jgi:TonB family protein
MTGKNKPTFQKTKTSALKPESSNLNPARKDRHPEPAPKGISRSHSISPAKPKRFRIKSGMTGKNKSSITKHKSSKPKYRPSASSSRKKYIRKNYGRIMSISQRTLLRLGIPRVKTHRKSARATASFTLYPNGSIRGLHLSRRSSIKALDHRTLQVVQRAHRRYPRPKVPVKINITMRYGL